MDKDGQMHTCTDCQMEMDNNNGTHAQIARWRRTIIMAGEMEIMEGRRTITEVTLGTRIGWLNCGARTKSNKSFEEEHLFLKLVNNGFFFCFWEEILRCSFPNMTC